jgi:hypothetical protein
MSRRYVQVRNLEGEIEIVQPVLVDSDDASVASDPSRTERDSRRLSAFV